MKKVLLFLLLTNVTLLAQCCCVPLINMLITQVETKLDTTIDDDKTAIDKLIDRNNYLNDEYLSDLTTEIKSDVLETKDKLSKFLIEDSESIYHANAKVDALKFIEDKEQIVYIEDVIEKKLGINNFQKILAKQKAIKNKLQVLREKEQLNEELNQIIINNPIK